MLKDEHQKGLTGRTASQNKLRAAVQVLGLKRPTSAAKVRANSSKAKAQRPCGGFQQGHVLAFAALAFLRK
ncbi:hypothetical protein D3C87_1587590 [compost metagenome]